MSRTALVAIVLCSAASADPEPRTWYGADLELLPSGTLHRTAGFGQPSEASAANAYALGGLLEHRIRDWLAVGFAPRVVWSIGPADAVSSASQQVQTGDEVDLRAHVALATDVSERMRALAYAAPGYAIGFEHSGASTLHPHGLLAGGGVAMSWALAPRFALVIDVGYQHGFQSYSDATRGTIEDRTAYWHLGVGFVTARDEAPLPAPAAVPRIAAP